MPAGSCGSARGQIHKGLRDYGKAPSETKSAGAPCPPHSAAANLDNSARTPMGSVANSKSATAERREPQWNNQDSEAQMLTLNLHRQSAKALLQAVVKINTCK